MAQRRRSKQTGGIISAGGTPFIRVDRKWSPYGTWGDINLAGIGASGRRKGFRYLAVYLALALGLVVVSVVIALILQVV